MSMFTWLISIVPHDKGEKLTAAAVKAGCGGGTVLMGRGLAQSNFGAAFGLGETTKDLIYMIVEKEQKQTIIDAIVDAAHQEKPNFGHLFSIDVESMMKTGIITQQEEKGDNGMETAQELISVILNKGYADDAMAAARKAGAGGGTVVNARGTAREDDEKFFGVHIVPEKEMLLIVVAQEKKEAVLNAIRDLDCLSEPGSGIAFCCAVNDFTLLGKNGTRA